MARKLTMIPQLGEKSFNLTVIDNGEFYLDYSSGKKRAVLCECVCGNRKLILVNKITTTILKNRAKSCGCNSYYPGQPKNASRNNPDSIYWELYRACKASAKRRNLEFKLTKEEHKEFTFEKCYYCGKLPELRFRNGIKFYANGIDRIDSSLGYVKENCASSCKICNNMKWEVSKDEFLNHIEKIVKYNNLLCEKN
jgi:hypothetical protein